MTCLVIQIPTPSGELNPDLRFTGFAFGIAPSSNGYGFAKSSGLSLSLFLLRSARVVLVGGRLTIF
jgi:hypothetical protein